MKRPLGAQISHMLKARGIDTIFGIPGVHNQEMYRGIEEAGITVESSDLTMLATSTVELDSVEAAKAVLRLVDALEDHDDVQHVYANMDIADDVLAAIDA